MKILYADGWMIDALTAAGLPRSTLLDIPALLNTLSADDVAFYLDVNRNLTGFIPAAIVNSFTAPVFIRPTDASDQRLKRVQDALLGRAIKQSKAVPADAKGTDKILTCDLLNADTILFRYIPAPTASTSALVRVNRFTERVIRQLYTMLTFEQLSVLPLVRMYLEDRQTLLTPNTVA